MMGNICIIPARGGSVRLPRKNILPFHGKPIIAYSIEAAFKAWDNFGFDKVVVSTDDGEIAEIASRYNADIFWRTPEVDWEKTNQSERSVNGLRKVYRKPYPDDGSKGTQEIARDVLIKMPGFDYICVIYPTAPMINCYDLGEGMSAVSRKHFNFSFGVGTNPLRDAGQFYWSAARALLLRQPLISVFSAMIPIDERRVCDINTAEDFAKAEQMYAALQEKK